ncbi:hypothetical protein K1T71_004025 [Dendrolimus kikuchii]|uniref:Uncharacterized protein n=1 Tax=Dendrolimus kikuchii TaxID=765133 RepID=A0ACC1DA08_9NEOP|nr:hypothetical protein K1T71_004025 [Dendrolimus kikuchii]
MDKDYFIDYYQVLQCDRTATTHELKKNYQRLLLSTHPDKMDIKNSKNMFLLVQKAWSVLKDSETRKQYDAMFSCHENSELLLYDTITLSDMSLNSAEGIYTYKCRCGGTYALSKDCVEAEIIIGCDECSFSIQVNK